MANRRNHAPKRKQDASAGRLVRSRTTAHGRGNRRTKLAQRKSPQKPRADAPSRRGSSREAVAIILGSAGLLTLLSLATYDASDASLNASGSAEVLNWIGPAGAYWADLMLQGVGIGAFALGAGLLLAGWRALCDRRVTPGFREGAGTLLLVICVGALAHLLLRGQPNPYPAGGVLGALLGELLLREFAMLGGYILSGALVLMSLALTADGILMGLGMRGLGAALEIIHKLHTLVVVLKERRSQLQLRRSELAIVEPADVATAGDACGSGSFWELGGELTGLENLDDAHSQGSRRHQERIDQARQRGRELGDAAADREVARAKKRALRDVSEPEMVIDTRIDIPDEQDYELGPLPALDATPKPAKGLPPPPPPLEVPIRAASPADRRRPAAEEAKKPTLQKKPTTSRPKSALEANNSAEPEIVDVRPVVDVEAIERAAEQPIEKHKNFQLPPPSLLDIQSNPRSSIDRDRLRDNATRLIKTLRHYGIEGVVREIRPGPVITMYEFAPAPGIKIAKIANLADDLAMSMEALRVRIVAPIPGKGAIGIEIPNETVETVYLKELITHHSFRKSPAKLPLAIGKDIEGAPFVADITSMPHLLVAGATGSGKSVSVNAMIMSILFNATPKDVRMIMVDPKMLELSVYDGVPHLLLPVVTDPKKAAVALRWAVVEMERRYKTLSALGVRNIDGYNLRIAQAADKGEMLTVTIKDKLGNTTEEVCEHLPYIVLIVDELADLMMIASRDVEASIMRLAQMARAAGIHLILATQRPSVDVLTGVIKANFPTRLAFQVASKHDSRTILDGIGAEHLLGRGDMLMLAGGASGIMRLHGSYVSEEEIQRTVAFVKKQGVPEYDESILAVDPDADQAENDDDRDEMWDQAVAIVCETRQASISMIQRRLRIGYNRAARLVEQMEREGMVGPADGAKPREVLIVHS